VLDKSIEPLGSTGIEGEVIFAGLVLDGVGERGGSGGDGGESEDEGGCLDHDGLESVSYERVIKEDGFEKVLRQPVPSK